MLIISVILSWVLWVILASYWTWGSSGNLQNCSQLFRSGRYPGALNLYLVFWYKGRELCLWLVTTLGSRKRKAKKQEVIWGKVGKWREWIPRSFQYYSCHISGTCFPACPWVHLSALSIPFLGPNFQFWRNQWILKRGPPMIWLVALRVTKILTQSVGSGVDCVGSNPDITLTNCMTLGEENHTLHLFSHL